MAERTVKISEETYQRLKEQLVNDSRPFVFGKVDDFIGRAWFIRTVTYHLVGKVTAITGRFLVMSDASWVADSGRFMQAIKSGTLSEVEPVGSALVSMDAITDAFPWVHPLPDKQK